MMARLWFLIARTAGDLAVALGLVLACYLVLFVIGVM